MATLTTEEKVKIRNAVERKAIESDVSISWIKGAINDAAQSVEDLITNSSTAISNAIDTATSPYGITFTAIQKKWIVAYTLFQKFRRDT